MSTFLNFLGGIGDYYAGYNKGADAELTRQQKAVRDQAERTDLQSKIDTADLRAQEQRLGLEAKVAAQKAEAEVAPIRQGIAKRSAQAESDMLPGNIKLAKGEQDRALNKLVFDNIADASTGAKTIDAAQTDVMALAGKQLALGNYGGLNQILDHVIQSPIFENLNGLGKPVKTELATPPEGAQDVSGTPAQPNSLKVTFEDGSVKWINTGGMTEAYRRQLASQYKPVISKPGEVARDPLTNRVLWKNDPNPPTGYVRDDDGNLIYMGGRGIGGAGGAGGAGAGRGGKAANPLQPASDAWEFVATKSEAKLPPEVNAYGHRLTQQFVTDGKPPTVAAQVALAIAQDPSKAAPSVDLRTGRIDAVYDAGRDGEFVVSRGIGTASNPGEVTPEQMKTAVTKFLGAQPEGLRDKLQSAAFDPEARKKLESDIFAEIDKQAATQAEQSPRQAEAIRAQAEQTKKATADSLSQKLSLISKFGTAPKAQSGRPVGPNASGGLPNFTPRAGTPDDIAQRMRDRGGKEADAASKREADAKAKTEADAAEKTQWEKAIEWATPEAIKVMTGSEARRMRDSLAWKYLDSDRRRLLTLQAGRSD